MENLIKYFNNFYLPFKKYYQFENSIMHFIINFAGVHFIINFAKIILLIFLPLYSQLCVSWKSNIYKILGKKYKEQ